MARRDATLLALQDVAAARMEHPEFAIPFRVHIAGRHYEGTEISLVGLTALGLIDPMTSNTLDARIEFPFSGFSVEIEAGLNLVKASIGSGIIEFAFADPMGSHRIPLQSIFNAHIAGELTQVPGLLGGKSPSAKVSGARDGRPKSSAAGLLGRAVKGLLLAGLAAGLAIFVGERVYQRLFVYSPSSVVRVAGDTVTIPARRTGTIVAFDENAAPGQVLASVLSDGSSLANYQMPCDCTVVRPQGEGTLVQQGQPLAILTPKTGQVYVAAEVEPRRLAALRSGSSIQVSFADGTTSPATLRSVPFDDGRLAERVPVTFSTERPLAAGEIGDVVSLTADSFPAFRRSLAQFFTQRTE